jgi:hypothetical protein
VALSTVSTVTVSLPADEFPRSVQRGRPSHAFFEPTFRSSPEGDVVDGTTAVASWPAIVVRRIAKGRSAVADFCIPRPGSPAVVSIGRVKSQIGRGRINYLVKRCVPMVCD